MEAWVGVFLTGLGVLFTIGGFVGRYWMQNVRADIEAQKLDFNRDVAQLEREFGEKLIHHASGFRDSFQSIREKISQVELYNEREFISKDTFGVVVAKLEKSIENLGLKIDGLGERLPPRA